MPLSTALSGIDHLRVKEIIPADKNFKLGMLLTSLWVFLIKPGHAFL